MLLTSLSLLIFSLIFFPAACYCHQLHPHWLTQKPAAVCVESLTSASISRPILCGGFFFHSLQRHHSGECSTHRQPGCRDASEATSTTTTTTTTLICRSPHPDSRPFSADDAADFTISLLFSPISNSPHRPLHAVDTGILHSQPTPRFTSTAQNVACRGRRAGVD